MLLTLDRDITLRQFALRNHARLQKSIINGYTRVVKNTFLVIFGIGYTRTRGYSSTRGSPKLDVLLGLEFRELAKQLFYIQLTED